MRIKLQRFVSSSLQSILPWARWLKRQGAWLRAGRHGFDPGVSLCEQPLIFRIGEKLGRYRHTHTYFLQISFTTWTDVESKSIKNSKLNFLRVQYFLYSSSPKALPRAHVCVCVSNANSLHFICFRFRAMRIDGTSVVYFRFTHLMGRPCYVGDVYLYLLCVCCKRNVEE